ncbi:rhodanese-like domain-containing protein [Fructobacillus durionis]|uniref:Rhodanese-related sulfurtransferase n=1 Tax=Fructobacillus durionis TaxID=283737 RepID=A0A1I1EZQ5_9LACO|nr:rhodanese-like domain-containing protein [Fructobacillus durionis]SFB92679.1 Rhodanese-related sulfurtransferase [Fructobacillus durionis]
MQILNTITLILVFFLLFYVVSALTSKFLARQRATVLKADAFIEKQQELHGQLIDVREKQPFKRSHLRGARNMPAMTFSQGKSGLRQDIPVFVYGDTLANALGVAKRLRKEGFSKSNLYLMAGGFRQYTARKNR